MAQALGVEGAQVIDAHSAMSLMPIYALALPPLALG
jgi:hypothetical protein